MSETGTTTVALPVVIAAICAGVSSTKPAPGWTQRSQLSVTLPTRLPAEVTSWIRNVDGWVFVALTCTCQRRAGPVSVALKCPVTCDCELSSGAVSSIGSGGVIVAPFTGPGLPAYRATNL